MGFSLEKPKNTQFRVQSKSRNFIISKIKGFKKRGSLTATSRFSVDYKKLALGGFHWQVLNLSGFPLGDPFDKYQMAFRDQTSLK